MLTLARFTNFITIQRRIVVDIGERALGQITDEATLHVPAIEYLPNLIAVQPIMPTARCVATPKIRYH
jgi:hypothetical protein